MFATLDHSIAAPTTLARSRARGHAVEPEAMVNQLKRFASMRTCACAVGFLAFAFSGTACGDDDGGNQPPQGGTARSSGCSGSISCLCGTPTCVNGDWRCPNSCGTGGSAAQGGTSTGGTTGQGGADAASDAAGRGGDAGSTGGSGGRSDGGCLGDGAPCNRPDQCCSRSCGGGGFTAQCR